MGYRHWIQSRHIQGIQRVGSHSRAAHDSHSESDLTRGCIHVHVQYSVRYIHRIYIDCTVQPIK